MAFQFDVETSHASSDKERCLSKVCHEHFGVILLTVPQSSTKSPEGQSQRQSQEILDQLNQDFEVSSHKFYLDETMRFLEFFNQFCEG